MAHSRWRPPSARGDARSRRRRKSKKTKRKTRHEKRCERASAEEDRGGRGRGGLSGLKLVRLQRGRLVSETLIGIAKLLFQERYGLSIRAIPGILPCLCLLLERRRRASAGKLDLRL